jgi:hypothetical protein
MPTTKTSSTPRAKTPFLERNGDSNYTLGNPRWKNIPFFPTRERVQEVVTDIDRAKCKRIITEYRDAEKTSADNDIGAKTAHIHRLESSGMSQDAVEAQRLRPDLERCDHEKHLKAQAKMASLIDEAAALVKPLLDRCIVSYDEELNSVALGLEAVYERMAFPLFTEHVNGTALYKDGAQVGRPARVWKLWERDECTFFHSCREVCRNLRQKFDGERHCTIVETKQDRAIPTMLFLCSNEETNFSWL